MEGTSAYLKKQPERRLSFHPDVLPCVLVKGIACRRRNLNQAWRKRHIVPSQDSIHSPASPFAKRRNSLTPYSMLVSDYSLS
jgi:hypothetical protein